MLSFLIVATLCQNKALIFAGSNKWGNYRHQADAWAVYQELIKRQFDKKNIRIACYDDIANHPLNKFKGKIFHDLDHKTNIYGGSELINYKNKITKETFREALLDLKGTKEDNLFIFYVDHGGTGILSVPNEEDGELTSPYINEVMMELYQKNSYNKCIFFILACLSGSIGEYIENKMIESNIKNTAIITSAKNNESSMGSYYDPWNDVLVSSQFSIAFIDKIRVDPECTISNLFDYLESHTKYSTPVYFGDKELKSMKISDFIGTTTSLETTNNIKANPITDEMFEKIQYQKSINTAADSSSRMKIKSEHESVIKKTKEFMMILKQIEFKLNILPTAKKIMNQSDQYKVDDDYFEILDHFIKSYGKIQAKDYIKFSTFILRLSKIASKDKVIEAIDEILKNK